MARLGQRLAQESGTGLQHARLRATWPTRSTAPTSPSPPSAAAAPPSGGVYGTAAHRADILIPAKYGIYQIVGDTGGPAGMMMGLRSIPVYLNICREMEKRAPRWSCSTTPTRWPCSAGR